MKKLYHNFIFDIVIAALALAIGIVMLPPFGIGERILDLFFALTLVAYIALYLFDKVRRAKGYMFVFTVIEVAVICFIIVGLIIDQFDAISIPEICRTLGLVIWLRGVVVVLGLYLSAPARKSQKKSLLSFIVGIFAISIGSFLLGYPLISDVAINWMLCIFLFVCALLFGFLALLFAPSKSASKNSAKDTEDAADATKPALVEDGAEQK